MKGQGRDGVPAEIKEILEKIATLTGDDQ